MDTKKRGGAPALLVIGISLTLILLLCSGLAFEKIREGLEICFRGVIPSVFLSTVASGIITKAMSAGSVSSPVPILLCGLLFGGQVGASGAAALLRDGKSDAKTYKRVICHSGVPSPFFVLSACRDAFGASNALCIYLITVLSSLVLWSSDGSTRKCGKMPNTSDDSKGVPITRLICDCIRESALSTVSVCAFVTLFYTLSSILTHRLDNKIITALVAGILEFSSGCIACTRIGGVCGIVLCCAILSFGGISVFMQICSIQSSFGTPMTVKEYLTSRLVQALLSSILSIAVFTKSTAFAGIFAVFTAIILLRRPFLQKIYVKRLKRKRFV